ncbi:MAG: hypothetical protein E3K32_03380 [wastewater metagenome]|nr:hypothetical protein [Candidatus Loosdrechtia aerotolerans]
MVATVDFVPGSSILGVFANEFIKKNNLNKPDGKPAHEDDTFCKWFLNGHLIFTNAYIVSYENGEERRNFPLPISMQHEKNNPKNIYDLLRYTILVDTQTTSIGDFGSLMNSYLYRESVKKSLNFHHQRDYETGTSKEGFIFNYESIDASQTFCGNILGSKDDLNTFLELFKNEKNLTIGRSRNAQYGKIKFEISSRCTDKYNTENDFLISESDVAETNNISISLTFLSNTIIYNDDGFPTTKKEVLEKILQKNTENAGLKIGKAFIKPDIEEGFVSVWRLRKPSETCFLAGSCFLIEGVSVNDYQKLIELQKTGIGERRGEGFGRISLGWQNTGEPELGSLPTKVNEPNFEEIPLKTKNIVIEIVNIFIIKQVELEALKDASKFIKLPSGSLIGRLEAAVKDKKVLKEYLVPMRSIAKGQLEGCINKHESSEICRKYPTLLAFLEEKNITIAEFLNKQEVESAKIRELCTRVKYDIENNSNFEKKLYHAYFTTFFSALRKIRKAGDN